MKKVFSIILVIILLISLTACGSSGSPVGSWHYAKNDTFNLVLNKDGTCTAQTGQGASVEHFNWRYDSSTGVISFLQDGVYRATGLIYTPDSDTIFVTSAGVYLTRK